MATIRETSRYVRSKGAGPFWMTVDIFCEDREQYLQFVNSERIVPKTFADIFGTEPEHVKIYYVENLNIVKISVPRRYTQGHKYENDMHCGQQYVRILDVAL